MGQPSSFNGRACAEKRSSPGNGTRNRTTAHYSQQSYEFPHAFSSPDIHAPKGSQSEICIPTAIRHHPQSTRLKSGPGNNPPPRNLIPSRSNLSAEAIILLTQVYTLPVHRNMSVYLFSLSSVCLAKGSQRFPENRDNIGSKKNLGVPLNLCVSKHQPIEPTRQNQGKHSEQRNDTKAAMYISSKNPHKSNHRANPKDPEHDTNLPLTPHNTSNTQSSTHTKENGIASPV